MKIKLTQNCVVNGSVEWAGTELDVPDTEATRLLNKGVAVAVKATKERAVKADPTEKAVSE